MAKTKVDKFLDDLLENLKDEMDKFMDGFFSGLPKNPEDADDATIKCLVRDAVKGSLRAVSKTKFSACRPEKQKLVTEQAMTFGGKIVGKPEKKTRRKKTTPSSLNKIPPKIPSSYSPNEVVDFLVSIVSDTEKSAIRSSLNEFSDAKLKEIADDATDRENTSYGIKSIMNIARGVLLERRTPLSGSSSELIPVRPNKSGVSYGFNL